jgi:hypothetical protein
VNRNLWIFAALLASIAVGTLADEPIARKPLRVGAYQVLSGDFHLHPALGSGGSLTPWGLVTEAQRQGLDVIAVTGHNTTWDARVAHAFSRLVDGPIVLIGEEVTAKTQDLVAVGIERTISPFLPLRDQIEEVHRQGGVAIAPHPTARFQAFYDGSGATALIDGTEVCHPLIYGIAEGASDLASFASRTPAAPIGASDFHASGRVGTCRTFIFVDEPTERGVLAAIRAHRTVVYGYNGRAFGDPDLVRQADAAGLRDVAARYTAAQGSALDWVSRIAAVGALIGLAITMKSRASRPAAERRGYGPRAPVQFPKLRSSPPDP